ncbi:hypothetical protein Bacsa_1699 [Phocaeicola salanitronis DSM 18170]|uniref:Uncharacterized protein n=2 Tax=Phocaeicola salanitronis TaxID=376805 RepID=F0R0Q8_PHOSB|nr:hypothetical protein Bacsa_1699 [Phocaeicola salanitronis DSM 18170]
MLNIQISISQEASKRIEKEKRYEVLEEECSAIGRDVSRLSKDMKRISFQLNSLSLENDELYFLLDSLCSDYLKMNERHEVDKAIMNQRVDETNNSVIANQVLLKSYTLYGILIVSFLVAILITVIYWLFNRIKNGDASIDELQKMQETLQITQTKMQEESIKLDNKLLEMAEQQIKIPTAINNQGTTAVDHSLALKVADEIVRIELNLSRMDSSIKGYKQLAKAVQRIKDNFQANGYEIIDMLGKPYNEGMKVIANFVSDETLERGKQIITGIVKPQINYNGKMIQSAQITVSQNI